MERYMRTHKFAWARLNSDALFIVLLALGAAIFNLLDPASDDVVQQLGVNPGLLTTPLFYLVAVGYIAGAFVIGVSLLMANIKVEVLGRTVLGASIAVELLRNYVAFGPLHNQTFFALTLLVIYAFTTTLRVSALFNKHGIVFHLPPRLPENDDPNTEEGTV